MFIETVKLQAKLAVELHRGYCDFTLCPGSENLDGCASRDIFIRRAAFTLGMLMPTIITEIVPAVRADERRQAADRVANVQALGSMSCPGGHQCACEWEALELAEKAARGDFPDLPPDPEDETRWQTLTDEIRRLSDSAGYGAV